MDFFATLWLFVRYVASTDPRRATLVGLLALAEGATMPVVIALTGVVVARAPAALGTGGGSPQTGGLIVAVLALGGAFVVGRVLTPARNLAAVALGSRVGHRMQAAVLDAVNAPAGLAHLEDAAMADEIKRAGDYEWEGLSPLTRIVDELAGSVQQLVGGIGAAVLLGRVLWWAPFALAACVVATHLAMATDEWREVRSRADLARTDREAEYLRDLALDPPAAKEVRLFGLADYLAAGTAERRAIVVDALAAVRRAHRGPVLVTIGAITASCGTVFGVLAARAVDGGLTASGLAVTVQAVLAIMALAHPMLATWWVRQGAAALPHVLGLADRAAAVLGGVPQGGRPADKHAPRASIRLRDVHFTYPGSAVPVLDGVDLTIEAGTTTAIVGVNGSGKTTLLKLLARLYDPSGGAIEIDGIDLRAIDPRSWRRQIAVIFQDFVRYELSAADNVGFGRVERLDDRAASDAAVRRAGVTAVLERLPAGWETTLSRRYPGGADLSGGEWQRIALARALRGADGGARVLVLDEPTAALDVRAEAELFDRARLTPIATDGAARAAVTTILVTHRLSSVRHADRIVVLERGRVVESGSHDELLARAGRYAAMFRLQADRFTSGAGVSDD